MVSDNAQMVWHQKAPFSPVTLTTSIPAAVCVHTPFTHPYVIHTYILTKAVLLEHDKTSKGYLRSQTLGGSCRTWFSYTAAWLRGLPLILEAPNRFEGRGLAWFLLLESKHYPSAERVLYH